MTRTLAWISLALLSGAPAFAERLLGEVEVSRDGPTYDVSMDVEIDLPREVVFEIVTDFPRIDRLSPAIVSSRVLSETSDAAEISVVVNICPAWLHWLPGVCRDFEQLQAMSFEPPGRLEMLLRDEEPNLFSGAATWSLEACDETRDCTLVHFDAKMTARIGLPHALLGGIVGRLLKGQAAEMIRGIERVGGRPSF